VRERVMRVWRKLLSKGGGDASPVWLMCRFGELQAAVLYDYCYFRPNGCLRRAWATWRLELHCPLAEDQLHSQCSIVYSQHPKWFSPRRRSERLHLEAKCQRCLKGLDRVSTISFRVQSVKAKGLCVIYVFFIWGHFYNLIPTACLMQKLGVLGHFQFK
jgi:hypothetical protein